MRKIFSQTIHGAREQQALARVSKALGVAQSRALETILCAIDEADLVALVLGNLPYKQARHVQLDMAVIQAIRSEIASSLVLLSNRTIQAAQEGARQGVLDACHSIVDGVEV